MTRETIAVAGWRIAALIAALVVLAAAVLWVVNPRLMAPDRLRFCQPPIDAVTTLWDRDYLHAPNDERCLVKVGPRTVAAGMAVGGVIALAILGVPLWRSRRRPGSA